VPPTETETPPTEEETVNSDGITDNIFNALTGDEKLTDDDRKAISEKLLEKTGGSPPPAVKPQTSHWSERKLW
jgi:hypothetical protein